MIPSHHYREALKERLFRYVQVDTRSDPTSQTCPSTPGQWNLLRMLESELKMLGLKDVVITEKGYVLATVPATSKKKVPTILFSGHVDTAVEFSGSDVKPRSITNYDGSVITYPDDSSVKLDPIEVPELLKRKGHELIVASGKTLLGADDKNGVAIIMTLVQILVENPSIPHGSLRICFNPDEEIARGMSGVTLEELGAEVAYTIDGDAPETLGFETFSADKADIIIHGVSVHPGVAKDKMVNALILAAKLLSRFPRDGISPETTSGKEGFIHPLEIQGNVGQASLEILLRDFSLEGLKEKRKIIEKLVEELRAEEPRAKIELLFQEQYRNMRYWLEKDLTPVNCAIKAIERTGLEYKEHALRGGTDGSVLTERGLPTPNLGSAAYLPHGPREWTSIEDLLQILEISIELVKVWEENADYAVNDKS